MSWPTIAPYPVHKIRRSWGPKLDRAAVPTLGWPPAYWDHVNPTRCVVDAIPNTGITTQRPDLTAASAASSMRAMWRGKFGRFLHPTER